MNAIVLEAIIPKNSWQVTCGGQVNIPLILGE
jgi:hypothetical protein